MSTPKTFPDFHPDRPITSATQDALGRKGFSNAIADRLAAWHGKDCLVAAIYGGWGTGKSSVKNMIVERLGEIDTSKTADVPHVVEFNPWQFSGSEQLTGEFFATLSEALVEHPASSSAKAKKQAAESADRLSLYGKLLGAGSGILSAGSVAASVLLPPAAPILQAGAAGAKVAADAAKSSRMLLDKTAPSLRALKQQLKSDFAGLKRKMLVVVDDIDRLTSDEVCLLFRLISRS
jgi:predicted KAP-like P-loop ATPase